MFKEERKFRLLVGVTPLPVPVQCFFRLTPLNGNFVRQDPTSESLILLSFFSRKEATKGEVFAFPVIDASLFI